MWRITLRNLWEHRLRTVLTCLAVAIGVALITGARVLVGSGSSALDSVWSRAYGGVAVAVQGLPDSSGLPGASGSAAIPQQLVGDVSRVPGVAAAQGQVEGQADLVSDTGNARITLPVTLMSFGSVPALQPAKVVQGHLPRSADQIVVDRATFSAQDWRLGQRVEMAAERSLVSFRVVGVVTFGGTSGPTIPFAGLDLPAAQDVLGLQGRLSSVLASARPGTSSSSSLVALVRSQVGPSFLTLSGAELASQAVSAENHGQTTLGSVLPLVGGVALFVGVLVVFNAVSIVVAQRRRELALLRCVGASVRQVRRTVLFESCAVGLLGSATGVVAGIAAAGALHSLGVQAKAATGPLLLDAGDVVLGLLLGTLVTVLASLVPAVRAGRTSPLSALHQDAVADIECVSHPRNVAGAVCAAAGVVFALSVLVGPLRSSAALLLLAIALLAVGLSLAGPSLLMSAGSAFGRPFARMRGPSARIGSRNAVRNARRTASTASALAVGVALVSFLAVTASSARASADRTLETTLNADFVVTQQGSGPLANGPANSVPLSPRVLSRLSSQPKLLASPMYFVVFLLRGQSNWGGAIDPATYPEVVDLSPLQGDFAAISKGGVAVSSGQAAAKHVSLGEPITVGFSAGSKGLVSLTVPVRAIYGHGDYYSGYVFSTATLRKVLPSLSLSAVFVNPRPGVTPETALAVIGRALRGFPDVVVQSASQASAQQNQTIQGLIDALVLLLVLAVAIAFLGIVNTLVLSVFERTKELALLRALGLSPRQLRAVVGTEATIVGVIGSLAGVAFGILLGWALQHVLVSQGFTVLVMPWAILLAIAALGALTGTLAGLFPARRAGRVKMLVALAEE
jgi:putative ABC transport system permease protein